METDIVYTFDAVNVNEVPRLRRRELNPADYIVLVISFYDIRVRKIANVMEFAWIAHPLATWSAIAQVLPIRFEHAIGDTCAFCSLESDWFVRAVIRKDSQQEAVDRIKTILHSHDLPFHPAISE